MCPVCNQASAFIRLDTSNHDKKPHYRAWLACDAHGWTSDEVTAYDYEEALERAMELDQRARALAEGKG